jgi:hypothetical protein
MPKQLLEVTDFSGGLNCYSDSRDIKDNQFEQNWNAIVDKAGIIRVAGMATKHIKTDLHLSTNMQEGFGLFQFTSDYSVNSIDGDFNYGIKSGTLSAGATGPSSAATLEATYEGSLNEFSNMMIFIYDGTGIGQSRMISTSTAATPPVLTLYDAFSTAPDSTSKYIIYRWKTDNGNWTGKDGSSHDKDFITDGVNGNMLTSINTGYENNFYIFSKKSSISNNTSVNLGYIEYSPSLTLKPGVKYNLSFDCAAKYKWYNMVADGDEDGADTSYGDKVPWVQLYSSTTVDSSGCIRSVDDPSPSVIGGAWAPINTTYEGVFATKTSRRGSGVAFNIRVDASGNPLFFFSSERGRGYSIDEVLTFTDPGTSGNTAEIVIQYVNRIGLSLYKNGFLSLTDQSGYIGEYDVNYIDNGDFADNSPSGTTDNASNDIAWTKVGADTLLTCSTLDANGYDGVDGTCKMTSTGIMRFVEGPEAYIYQDLLLDDMTAHHLNFVYDSPHGIMYSVYDQTNLEDIIPWTKLEATRLSSDAAKYRYAGAEYNTRYSDASNNFTMDYIRFVTPSQKTSSAISTRIRFAPIQAGSEVSIHGVTVHKGHHDLVTMSYGTFSAGPFSESIKNFNRYNMSFIIPHGYSEVSDWELRFHAGQYGQRDSNTLHEDATAKTQEVYFDNIRLTSEEGDTLTLLTDNNDLSSNIALYSKLSGTWIKDMIRWGGLNSKPVYDYVNGMLKVSDGNFNNSNENKLMYYSDVEGWKIKDYSIPKPPFLLVKDIPNSASDSIIYDAIQTIPGESTNNGFLNKYFSGDKFCNTNWDLSQYGSEQYHGLIIRYFGDQDAPLNDITECTIDEGFHANDNMQAYLFNTECDFYNLASGLPGAQNTTINTAITGDSSTDQLTTSGYYEGDSITGTDFHKPLPSTNLNDTSVRAHNPLYFVIKGTDENGLGMNDIQPVTSGSISKVIIGATYQLSGYAVPGYTYESSHLDYYGAPYFRIEVGKVSEEQDESSLKDNLILGNDISFSSNATSRTVYVGQNYEGYDNGIKNWNMLVHEDKWRDEYDVHSESTVENMHISQTTVHETGYKQIRGHIEFTANFEFSQMDNISKEDDLLVKIELLYSDGDNITHLKNIFSGFGSYGQYTGMKIDGTNSQLDLERTSAYELLKINTASVEFFNENYDESDNLSITGSGKETQINFTWDIPESGETSAGWGSRKFVVGVSCENIFGEESSISKSNQIIGQSSDGTSLIEPGYAPSVYVSMGNSHFQDKFVSKTKFYMKDTESDIWYLQFYVDHKTEQFYSTTSGITSTSTFIPNKGVTTWTMDRNNLKNFNEVNSYESETFISQDDAMSNSDLTCRYKTSVVANNRLYVGNIYQNDRVYGDRMIKSPIGKYNLLPKSNFIDVEINDGDDITALAYYKDKILQFKKRKVFVISTSGDYEFLEDTFENIGVTHQAAVCTTPHGIAWVNKSGCHIYDGEKVKNLVEKTIPVISDYSAIANNYWKIGFSSYNNNPSVAYSEIEDSILVKWTISLVGEGSDPAGATYNFTTNSWCFVNRAFTGSTTDIENFKISNMITDENGDILFYRFGPVLTGPPDSANSIKKWNHAPLVIDHSGSGIKVIAFKTKDFTFGNIATRKKLYKVYITYKTNSDSGIEVTGAVNGTKSFSVAFSTSSKFQNTTTACYAGTTLDSTGNVWKTAELKFATPSQVNNINSFQLSLAAGQVPADFEINDISISYKVKRVK